MTTNEHETDTGTLWVCVDCIMVAANDEYPEEAPDHEPLSLLSGYETSIGLTEDEHLHNFDTDSECIRGECNCETKDFSWQRCDGCGSPLAGSRHAMTIWPLP